MNKRRNLTPPLGFPAPDGVHAMRRTDARREVSERVTVCSLDGALLGEGWALNISRGGVRAILEFKVDLGVEYAVTIGEEGKSPLARRGRVVWVQEEHDGLIAGIEFVRSESTDKMHAVGDGTTPAPPEAADSGAPAPNGDPDEPEVP